MGRDHSRAPAAAGAECCAPDTGASAPERSVRDRAAWRGHGGGVDQGPMLAEMHPTAGADGVCVKQQQLFVTEHTATFTSFPAFSSLLLCMLLVVVLLGSKAAHAVGCAQ